MRPEPVVVREPTPPPVIVAGATAADRRALRVLQAGALTVVLVATTYKAFELDRFFIPKELTLHLTALTAGLMAVRAFRRTAFSKVDLLLILYLLVGLVSTAFATNVWVATRALAVSASGVAIYWAARAVREAGLARPLLTALAAAVVVGAATACFQTYGMRTDLFSINRAPGGTLGNRNFIAHLAAFGVPVVLYTALAAASTARFALGAVGVAIVTSSLVITRSRAGWLAFGAVVMIWVASMLLSPVLRRHAPAWRRLGVVVGVAAAGVAAAVLLPNTLRWRSDNPYLESISGIANYQEGSGRGRLVQYRRSLEMMAKNPVLGVGPGNWPVEYPAYAAGGDPSLDRSEPGTTSNPWPSSDWIAAAAERGLPATILLALAFIGIAMHGVRQLVGARDADQSLAAAALLATVVAANVAGMFDAVLLLALPTLIVWAALGALSSSQTPQTPPARPGSRSGAALIVVALIAGLGALHSAAQLVAIGIYSTSRSAASLSRAALIDPGNYRVRMKLAQSGRTAKRCRHARAAHALLPSAREARAVSRGCGD